MAVKLSDIAFEAGVSTMTVSNVMNGKSERVSAETSARVREIADRLGYVPNLPARGLAAAKSRIVAALVPARAGSTLDMSPHTVTVLGGLEPHFRAQGYHVLVRGIEHERDIASAIHGWNLDGAILMDFKDTVIDELDVGDVPLVAIDSYSTNVKVDVVRTDDRHGGWLAGSHLAQHGHRRVLFAGAMADGSGVITQRWEGFKAGSEAAGVEPEDVHRVEVFTTFEDGRALGRRLRADFSDVTGVFATADSLAIGIMAGLTESGSSLPDDVSIIGFDNIDVSAYVTPSLTTVAQDVRRKGARAAELLISRISKAGASLPATLLNVDLVERGSVRSPRR